MLKSTGSVAVDPYSRAQQKKWWVILRCCNDLAEYYRGQINYENRARFQVEPPLWPSHISIIRGEMPPWHGLWPNLPDGLELPFWYDPTVYTNGKHFWLPVFFPAGTILRTDVGLDPAAEFSFHLTVAVRPGPGAAIRSERRENLPPPLTTAAIRSGSGCWAH